MRTNLVDARKKRDFTQVQLAKELGISDRHYKALEAGTSKGSIDIWEKMRKIFGQSIDYLLEQEVELEKEPDGNRAK